jgi:hypothetical protein
MNVGSETAQYKVCIREQVGSGHNARTVMNKTSVRFPLVGAQIEQMQTVRAYVAQGYKMRLTDGAWVGEKREGLRGTRHVSVWIET